MQPFGLLTLIWILWPLFINLFFLLSHTVSGVSSYTLSCVWHLCLCPVVAAWILPGGCSAPACLHTQPSVPWAQPPSSISLSSLCTSGAPSGAYVASSISLQDPRRSFQAPPLIVPWFGLSFTLLAYCLYLTIHQPHFKLWFQVLQLFRCHVTRSFHSKSS